ncbi:MAG: pyruvate kinase [Rhodospirillaceae bacterium]|nr:pyruvate kinase [Rhodospirillaceae bacterium]|tara:strand:- start:11414 stop:12817 length:1404 start_codon:yes stop_codon:yes gene_type:complete
MRRDRQAKIVATLGPATSSPEAITELFEAGVDVFRLNMSHGDADDHRARYNFLRELEVAKGRPVGILADLQGPKLRIGQFVEGEVQLERGQSFHLDMDETPGDTTRIGMPHPEIFATVKPGHQILLDDGRVVLRVDDCGPDFATTTVEAGDYLSNNKGLNLPGVQLPIAALTEKDREDLAFALELGADWVALSFVQRPEDIAEARELVAGRAAVMAKLEKPSAIDSLQGIVELADGIMVARGDLGVELKPEEVPGLQKRIVRACRQAGKPVIVATQMLESMIDSPTPTRAEASDVATAVYDGADALMLSGETAVGEYPGEAVAMMDRIMVTVENDPLYDPFSTLPEATSADAISAAARQVAQTVNASAIVTYSVSGATTLRASRVRPDAPILGLTPKITSARRLALVWGVHSVHTEDAQDFADMVRRACTLSREEGFADPGDRIIITAGVPFGTPGATNTLRIAWID